MQIDLAPSKVADYRQEGGHLVCCEEALWRCRVIVQTSKANTAIKMAAIHQGLTPSGMGKRITNSQSHHGHLVLFCGSSMIRTPSI